MVTVDRFRSLFFCSEDLRSFNSFVFGTGSPPNVLRNPGSKLIVWKFVFKESESRRIGNLGCGGNVVKELSGDLTSIKSLKYRTLYYSICLYTNISQEVFMKEQRKGWGKGIINKWKRKKNKIRGKEVSVETHVSVFPLEQVYFTFNFMYGFNKSLRVWNENYYTYLWESNFVVWHDKLRSN